MRTTCLVILAMVFSLELIAQTHLLNSSYPNLNPLRIKNTGNLITKSDSSNFGEHFPFQIGLEAGYLIPINEQLTSIRYGLIGYLDFNVFRKKIFIKLEIGSLYLDDERKSVVYGSLSGNFRLLRHKQSRGFINLGLGFHRKSYTVFLSGSIKYVYTFNELFGITANIKFLGTYNPFIALGVQFFNN